jgi:hypothetical protein
MHRGASYFKLYSEIQRGINPVNVALSPEFSLLQSGEIPPLGSEQDSVLGLRWVLGKGDNGV